MYRDDSVNGQVIGDVFAIRCALYYDGRRQSQDFFAQTESEGKAKALEHLDKIKEECGVAYTEIFPCKKWEIRFYD